MPPRLPLPSDLATWFEADERVPVRALLDVTSRLAKSLGKMENPGGHRHIEPKTIQLLSNGTVTVARLSASSGNITYQSPERLQSAASDPSADVFAVGVCLWEGLTGASFSRGATEPEWLALAYDETDWNALVAERCAQIPSDRPAELVQLVRACLDHSASQRPSLAKLASEAKSLARRTNGLGLREAVANHRVSGWMAVISGPLVFRDARARNGASGTPWLVLVAVIGMIGVVMTAGLGAALFAVMNDVRP